MFSTYSDLHELEKLLMKGELVMTYRFCHEAPMMVNCLRANTASKIVIDATKNRSENGKAHPHDQITYMYIEISSMSLGSTRIASPPTFATSRAKSLPFFFVVKVAVCYAVKDIHKSIHKLYFLQSWWEAFARLYRTLTRDSNDSFQSNQFQSKRRRISSLCTR